MPSAPRSDLHAPPPLPDPDALLARFRRHSAYYARRLAGISRWGQVPPLERDDVRNVPVVAHGAHILSETTSGTSGVQVRIHFTRAEGALRRSLLYRPFGFYRELPEVVRQAIFVDVPATHESPLPDVAHIRGRFYHRYAVSAQASVARQVGRLLQVHPHLLTGFPSAMVRFVEEAGPLAARLRIRVVSPAGEYLSSEWRRQLAAFGAPVRDRFGATETGALAWECPECGAYHANTDLQLLEPHEEGLVVTPLFQGAQPLLRYHLGDHVAWAASGGFSCRVALPRVRIHAGRRDDWLFDGRDRRLSPLVFEFETVSGLRRWSIRQRPDGSIDVGVSWLDDAADRRLDWIVDHVRRLVPGRTVRVVDFRALGSMGKFKRVRCDYRPSTQH